VNTTCDRRLIYRQTVYNGVNPRERWDYYDCIKCGPFEYRHRTRKSQKLIVAPLPTEKRRTTRRCDRPTSLAVLPALSAPNRC